MAVMHAHAPVEGLGPATERVFEIRGLKTIIPTAQGPGTTLVDGISVTVARGETLAVVGESGSGKTMTFLSALGIAPPPARVVAGSVLFEGVDLLSLPPAELRQQRGAAISMVFQDPLSALNPVFSIGSQIVEVLRAHLPIGKREARERAIALLERVHIPDPRRRVDDYPHQLSGGMRQRALIAMAIALGPRVLIADEPTTALDVTVQAQILELLAELQDETGMGLVLITHDLGLVARHADRVAVFYAGRVVEEAAVDPLFTSPRHPYTIALFRAIPHLDTPAEAELTPIVGQPPNLAALPQGCPFEPRCFLGRGRDNCRATRPGLVPAPNPDRRSACLHWSLLAERKGR
jgi:oligopeptide transport system ATP-binding protein